MKNKYILLLLAGAALFCGCDKQTRINTEKIAVLSQKMVQLQQNQATQLATIQSQLTALAPMLDKMNDFYFEKTHDEAFFFHTNTLYLMLTVGKKIEAQLQAADTERQSEHVLAYGYHTNELHTMYLCAAQIEEAMDGHESRITDKVNAETRRVNALLSDELLTQIKLSAPDTAEIARQKEMAATVAQMKLDLDQIKARLGITNSPAAKP